MILGIGTDIIELQRVRNSIAKPEFREKVYSPREIEYCEKDAKGERYAARFAAKEAFFKALGTGWRGEMAITEIEIINDESGKPHILLSGKALEVFKSKGGNTIHVSLAHVKEMALAYVIIEKT